MTESLRTRLNRSYQERVAAKEARLEEAAENLYCHECRGTSLTDENRHDLPCGYSVCDSCWIEYRYESNCRSCWGVTPRCAMSAKA